MFTKLEVKRFFCSDVELETWRPEDPRNFSIWLQIDIGQEGSVAADTFQVHVTTHEAIREQRPARQGRRRYMIVLDTYDYGRLKAAIEEVVGRCNRLTWVDSVEALREQFWWEYEGMGG